MTETLGTWWAFAKRVDLNVLHDADWHDLCFPDQPEQAGCSHRTVLLATVGNVLDAPTGAEELAQYLLDGDNWRSAPHVAALAVVRCLRRVSASETRAGSAVQRLLLAVRDNHSSDPPRPGQSPQALAGLALSARALSREKGGGFRLSGAGPGLPPEMDPVRFDSPPACDPKIPYLLAQRFQKDLDASIDREKSSSRRLDNSASARHAIPFDERWLSLRTIQWEVLTRDFRAEEQARRLSYRSATQELHGHDVDLETALPLARRRDLIHSSWLAAAQGSKTEAPFVLDAQDLDASERMFKLLLKNIDTVYADAYEDITGHFSERGQTEALLVEDGEFSFFSLLWLLRAAVRHQGGQAIKDFVGGSRERLALRFSFQEASREPEWSDVTIDQLLTELGWAGPLGPSGEWCLSARGLELVAWLHAETERYVTAEPTARRQHISIKALDPQKQEHEAARAFASSYEALLERLHGRPPRDPGEWCKASTASSLARTLLLPLLELLDESRLLAVSNSLDDPWDTALLRACRTVCLPPEYALRRYAPFPMNLYVIPLNRQHGTQHYPKPAPTSLGFFTVVGRVRPSATSDQNGTSAGSSKDDAVAPYWMALAGIAGALSFASVRRASDELARYAGQYEIFSAFSHEAGKAAQYLTMNLHVKAEHLFDPWNATCTDDDRWKTPVARLASIDPSASAVGDWLVCPVPAAHELIKRLFAIWGGTRNLFPFLGIPEDAGNTMASLWPYVEKLGRSAGAMRWMMEQIPWLDSVQKLKTVDDLLIRGPERYYTEVVLSEETRRIFERVSFRVSDDGIGPGAVNARKAEVLREHMVRGLMATLANCVFHVKREGVITVETEVRADRLRVSFTNPRRRGRQDNDDSDKPRFWVGTKAVCQYLFRYNLWGDWDWDPHSPAGFLTFAEVPFVVDGVEWIDLK